jgi:hypothetical protein
MKKRIGVHKNATKVTGLHPQIGGNFSNLSGNAEKATGFAHAGLHGHLTNWEGPLPGHRGFISQCGHFTHYKMLT